VAEPDRSGPSLLILIEVMARLRAECDWKSAQTHRSLARHLLEETYETLEAIETGDPVHLREELGDLLLQVYFHAEIARESGDFSIDDVASDLIDKLVRRNPHVFGDSALRGNVSGPAAVNELWESVKAVEKQRDSVLDGIPPHLPALLYADKVLDRLKRAGGVVSTGSSTDSSSTDSSMVELVETMSTSLGDRLLALVAECREEGVDPEQALRDAVRRLL
jgi:XTP/dITP diphosphohydrolase